MLQNLQYYFCNTKTHVVYVFQKHLWHYKTCNDNSKCKFTFFWARLYSLSNCQPNLEYYKATTFVHQINNNLCYYLYTWELFEKLILEIDHKRLKKFFFQFPNIYILFQPVIILKIFLVNTYIGTIFTILALLWHS